MFRESLPFIHPSIPPVCSLVFASCSFSGQIEASGGWGSLEYVEPYWMERGGAGRGGRRRRNFSDRLQRQMPNPMENQLLHTVN